MAVYDFKYEIIVKYLVCSVLTIITQIYLPLVVKIRRRQRSTVKVFISSNDVIITAYIIWELSHMPHFQNIQNIDHLDFNRNWDEPHKKRKNEMSVAFIKS